ncbi:MAG: lytic transglycosylase domain-containing protein, partial [Steroidobacteraceae bacterium]
TGGRIWRGSDFAATSSRLDAMFGFPAGTMQRLIARESSFNPLAVSNRGAMGLGGLMPGTAFSHGLNYNTVFDPRANETVSAEYLASLIRRYHGNMQEALAAYNWGSSHVDKLLSRYGASWRGHLPKGVNAYVTALSPDNNIVVTARHKTGGNPVLSAAGLAGVPQ